MTTLVDRRVSAEIEGAHSPAITATAAQNNVRWIVVVVGLFYFLFFLLLFRQVVPAIPSILAGKAVINGDELVPFFNPSSQLIEQAAGKFNQLTNGYEFRVRYSILTTWVRYYKVLPFAILLVIPGVTFVAYLAVARFLAAILPTFRRQDVYWAAAGPTLVIFLILTYSKITHFYTLVLGFSLYTVAAVLAAYGIIFAQKRPYRYVIAACLCTLFNPAIHYLILFALYMALTVGVLLVVEVVKFVAAGGLRQLVRVRAGVAALRAMRPQWRTHLGTFLLHNRVARVVIATAMLGFVTLLPYGLFVKYFALRGVKNLSETVPADYYFIKDASIPWGHVLSFDMAGIMDKLLTGDYLAREPRLGNVVYTILLFMPLLIPVVRRRIFNTPPLRDFMVVVYALSVFSMWATLGYSDPTWLPTFHRVLSAIVNLANGLQSTLGDLVVRLGGTVVQVLRFPHRFQLIVFMMAVIVLPLPLLWIKTQIAAGLGRIGQGRWARFVLPLLFPLFLVPLLSSPQYRYVFFSGDFNGFLRAYPVTPLQEVKEFLLTRPIGKVVVLPPTESAKVVVDINNSEHKFIDKFHIYYLDLPSYYYGLTGDSDNKHEFFLLLRALYYQEDWWINIARDLELRYIVVNKEMLANSSGGAEYLREIEKVLIPELNQHPDYVQPVFDNESYVVYEFIDLPTAPRVPLFIESNWNTFIRILSQRLDLSRTYDLRYSMKAEDLMEYETLILLADDPADAALDLYIKAHPKQFATVNSVIFAFNPAVIPSSYYLSPMFRLFQFFSDSKWNRLNLITPGLYGTINGSFTAVPKATEFRLDVTLPTDGEYRLLLRGVATANQIAARSQSLNYLRDLELRAASDTIAFYDQSKVFDVERTPVDLSIYSVAEVERLIPQRLVAVNGRYDYFDLGVVQGAKGKHTIYFNKLDNSPFLIEGVLVIEETEYQQLQLPDNVRLLESPADLCCATVAPAP